MQASRRAITSLEEESRCLEMEASGIKRETRGLSNSRLKLIELLSRLQNAAEQTTCKIEDTLSKQCNLEVNPLGNFNNASI